jgi:hypothetical protein
VYFDARRDPGILKQVPPKALQRFEADVRSRRTPVPLAAGVKSLRRADCGRVPAKNPVPVATVDVRVFLG